MVNEASEAASTSSGAQESSLMIREAQEATATILGAQKKILANDQRGTISRSRVCNIRAFGSSSMIGEAVPQEAASAICTEAQESSPIITEAPEAAPAISRRKSPHQSSARHKRLRQQYRGARVLISDPEQQIACTRGSIGHIEAQESS